MAGLDIRPQATGLGETIACECESWNRSWASLETPLNAVVSRPYRAMWYPVTRIFYNDSSTTICMHTPGPDADTAFRTGQIIATIIGLSVVGLLWYSGAFSLYFTIYVLLFLFPIYLILSAAVLSVWLGQVV